MAVVDEDSKVKLEAIKRGKTVVEKVVDQILIQLATGALNPGDSLPVEARLAETFKIGRSTIREALRILEGKGIVDIVPRKGVVIKSIPDEILERGTVDLALNVEAGHLPEILDCLVIVISGGAKIACERRTAKDTKNLKGILSRIEKCEDAILQGKATHKNYQVYADLYIKFYSCIGMATHNAVYIGIFDALVENLRKYLPFGEFFLTQNNDDIRARAEFDRELVRAIEAKDSDRAYHAALKKAEQLKKIVSVALDLRSVI